MISKAVNRRQDNGMVQSSYFLLMALMHVEDSMHCCNGCGHAQQILCYLCGKKENYTQARLHPTAIKLSQLLAMISKVINSPISTVVSCMSLIVSVHRYCTSYANLVPGIHRWRKERCFSHLHMREVNYFLRSIILHNDATILIVFN